MTWVHFNQCIWNLAVVLFLVRTHIGNLKPICFIHMNVQSHPQLWSARPVPVLTFIYMLSYTNSEIPFFESVLTHIHLITHLQLSNLYINDKILTAIMTHLYVFWSITCRAMSHIWCYFHCRPFQSNYRDSILFLIFSGPYTYVLISSVLLVNSCVCICVWFLVDPISRYIWYVIWTLVFRFTFDWYA